MRKIMVALTVLLSILGSCKNVPDHLAGFLHSELEKKNGRIDLRNYNKIEWDKLYIICPYIDKRTYDANLLRYCSEIEETGIGGDESFKLLLLFYGEDLVSLSKVPVKLVDFVGGCQPNGSTKVPYARDSSFFRYKIDAYGSKWLPTKN